MANVEFYILEQVNLGEKIHNSYNALPEDPTRGRIKARFSTLEANFKKFQNQHVELLKLPRTGKIPYFDDHFADQVEEWYQEAKGNFLDALDNLDSSTMSSNATQPPQMVNMPVRSFPKITLPTFSGNYADWANFSDLFTSLIDQNTEMSDVIKLQHLKTSLSGEAAFLLKNIPVVHENYGRAWSILVKQYRNRRLLIKNHLTQLFALQPMPEESAAALKHIVSTVEDILEALRALGCPVEHWSHFLVHFVSSRLDNRTLREWESPFGDTTEPPTYEALLAFLKGKICTLQILEVAADEPSYAQPSNQPPRQSTQRSGPRSRASTSHLATSDPQEGDAARRCYNCGELHFLMYCHRFKAMTAAQRREVITKKKLCFNCLRQHNITDCPSHRTCRLCDKKHHTLLHMDSPTVNHASAVSSVQTDSSSSSSSGATSSSSSSSVATVNHVVRPLSKGLLPTALVRVAAERGSSYHRKQQVKLVSSGRTMFGRP